MIRSFKSKPTALRQVKTGQAQLKPFRERKRIGNGNTHVRYAQLGHHRTVPVFNQGMDDRLRVDHHLNLFRRNVKKPTGLDHLQAFIHQCG